MRWRAWTTRVGATALAATVAMVGLPASATGATTLVDVPPAWAPAAAFSTSGDFATDTFGNPWDFADDADVPPYPEVASSGGLPVSRVASTGNASADGGGWLRATTGPASEIRFHFDWPVVLPWGRDGRIRPIDASVYRRLSMRLCTSGPTHSAIRWWNDAGTRGTIDIGTITGCADVRLDLASPGAGGTTPGTYVGPELGPWAGKVTRLVFFQAPDTGSRTIEVDYVRIHRADTAWGPAGDVPRPVVLSPSAEGEGDWATDVRGNPWDFAAMDDVAGLTDLTGARTEGGSLIAANTANDPSVELAVPTPIDGAAYHRLTVDACMDGRFSLGGGPGEGTVSRLVWLPSGQPVYPDTGEPMWTESQDVVAFPGCHRMTFDLRTSPARAVHDEHSATTPGWVCRSIERFRWDPVEDPGPGRTLVINEVKLGRAPSFTTTTALRFRDEAWQAGSVADVFVSADPAATGGTLVRSAIPVVAGVNTVTWDGRDTGGTRLPGGSYWVQVRIRRADTTVTTARAASAIDFLAPGASGPGTFVPLAPTRVLDTRSAPTPVQGCRAPVPTAGQIDLDVLGRAGVPADGVTAVVLNVTGITPNASTYVTVWPTGEPRPVASNLNLAPGGIRPNLVTAKVGAGGRVSLYNDAGVIDLAADVVGYFTTDPNAARFVPITPERAFDTRTAGGPLGPKETRRFTVAGATLQRVPAGVDAVAVNVTGVLPTATTYLTVFPDGAAPLASNLNLAPGRIAPNLVTVPVRSDGTVAIFNDAGSVHVVGDVVGFFRSDQALTSRFVPVTPERAFDTRWTAAPLGPGGTRTFPIAGLRNVPAGVRGVAINVTAVGPSASTFVTVWPAGEDKPWASSLNAAPGDTVPNLVFAKLGADGSLALYNDAGTTHLVGDVIGYFT
jgi:hypothetical protein